MRILLVEDEAELANMIVGALSRNGMVVDHADNLALAEEALRSNVHEAVILDRGLPDGDGLTLLDQIKSQQTRIPVIVLSALGSLDQRIEGLDTGADDYLAKPFAIDELLARLRALVRRPSVVQNDKIKIGRLVFDRESRAVEIEGENQILPRREFLALEALIQRSGRVVTRETLEQAVYGFDDEIASNTLDAHISRLRRKLAPALVEIHAMRGIGYLLRAKK